uniref:Termicin n=1 Tax=Steinernema glaseri TaxID=37863 RepID=A0A1I7YWH6_9BILA
MKTVLTVEVLILALLLIFASAEHCYWTTACHDVHDFGNCKLGYYVKSTRMCDEFKQQEYCCQRSAGLFT